MKMRNRHFLILFFFAALVSCQKPENDEAFALLDDDSIEAVAVELKDYTPSTPANIKGISDTCNSKTFTLVAGQTIPVGTVVVSNDLNFIYVTYNTIGEWKLDQVHLYVQDAQPAQRLTPGQTTYKVDPLPGGTTNYTFIVPMDTIECGSSIWIQAHASVSSNKSETAYGGVITPAGGGSWYGNISYSVECCEPPEVECKLSASTVVVDVKCYRASTGSIDLTVVDGTAPYTFLWNNGTTTEDLGGLSAGTYSVTVTDNNGCTKVLNSIVVSQPASAITASATTTNITVFGAKDGKIDVDVSGGTGSYTFLWSNGATTEDISGLAPGTYTLKISDANGCNETVEGVINEGNCPPITINNTLFNLTCEALGVIDITVTGGTAPYLFLWSNGSTSEDLNGLTKEGDYSVIVTDANKCEASLKVTLIKDCKESPGIVAFARKTWQPMVHCFSEYGFTEWGWTNGALPEAEGFTSRYELFINAGGCDVANATKVGEIKIKHFGGTTTAAYTLLPGFTMSETALYVGNEILPKVGADYTIDPAMYPNIHKSLGAATTDTYSVSASGNIYIIGYALINPVNVNAD